LDGQFNVDILLVDAQYGWDVSSNSPLDEQFSDSIFQKMSSSVMAFLQEMSRLVLMMDGFTFVLS
jgi:hypothetical protein